MRAVLCHSFTGPEDLRVGEIEEPKPGNDEPPAPQELLDCRCFYWRLDREVP
jgi:hypothetical protein